MIRALACLAALALPAAAMAQTAPDVQALAQAEIARACDGRGGVFTGGLFDQDLTGDGLGDLILDHGGITCNGDWKRSGFCGAQVCTLMFYVRDANGLRFVDEGLGLVTEISPTPVPLIGIYAHGGPVFQFRWNGSEFVNVGE